MTSTFIFAFLLMLVVVSVMAVGVVFGRQPMSGSCGGMKALGLDMECEICGGDLSKCDSSTIADSESELDLQNKRLGN